MTTNPGIAARISMHRLSLLGHASIERDTGTEDGLASRPRALALLALLAVGKQGGVARDKCLVYLWPESDTRRARNSLHQTLYGIRSDLGVDTVDSGPPLRIRPERFTVDLWEFDDALAAGDLDAAIALYAGPFLDGFALEGLPELDEWIEAERLRITRKYATALEQSARSAGQRGDHVHALHQWRVRAQLDPLSAPPTLGLMQALVASGDRASAIEAGDSYAHLVQRELGCAPDSSIAEFSANLRKQRITVATIAGPDEVGTVMPDGSSSRDGSPIDPTRALPAETPPTRVSGPARDRRLRNARVLAVLSLAALGVMIALSVVSRTTAVPRSPERIAVFPFAVSGPPESQYLGDGLVDLLATSFDGAGSISGVDPRALLHWLESNKLTSPTPGEAATVATRFGAGRFVLGSVAGSGSRLRILASLYRYDRPDSAIGSAVTEGDATDLFRLVDQLTSQLLAASLPEPRHRLMRVAALTTPSLPALKNYLAGEQELRAGNYIEAADAFQRAVREDSGFALAYYRLAIAADWLGRDSQANVAAEAAFDRAGRLSERDSLLVDGALTARRGNHSAAERIFRRIVVDHPNDIEAWTQLGELLFHGNPLRGRSVVEARDPFERILALDPDDAEAQLHLARICYLEGDQAAVDSLAARLTDRSTSAEVLELRAFRAFALSDRDSWKRVTRELLNRPPDVLPVTALQVALFLDDVDGTKQFAAMLTDRRYSAAIRGLGHRLLARAFATRGQWNLARVQLDSSQQFDPVATLELRSLLASLDFLDVAIEEVRAVRADVERWDGSAADQNVEDHSTSHVGLHAGIRAYRLGMLSARLGDTVAVIAQATALERDAERARGRAAVAMNAMSHSLRARLAYSRGDAAEALRELDRAQWVTIESGFEEEAGDRYYRAHVLTTLGRETEALNWFRTIAERGMHELVYLAPSRLRESILACRRGDRSHAEKTLATAARLWDEAAPQLKKQVIQAKQNC